MLILVVAAESLVARHDLRFLTIFDIDWKSSGRAAARHAPGFDIVVFGDSMAKFGIAPRVIEATLGRKVHSFALLDGKPAATYLFFRRAIEAGARPSAVIVDYPPEMLNQTPESLLLNPRWTALMANPYEAWELARIYHDREFFGRLLVARVLPSYRSRDGIRTDLLTALQGQSGSNSANTQPERRNRWLNRGGILLAKNPGFQGDVPPQWAGILFDAHCTVRHEHAHFVRRLIRLAAEHNIAVYWLLPPNAPKVTAFRDASGVHARYERFARALLAQFPNLYVLDARHAGYEHTVFVDAVHLDRDGATALSGDVAEVLGHARINSAPGARWIELPRYHDRPVTLALEDVDQSRTALKRRAAGRRR
jgi:hypothetical protein